MSNNKPSLRGVLSDTSRIISANSRHFLALSVLFLFPISLTSVYPLPFHPTSLHSHYRLFLSNISTPDSKPLLAGKSQLLIQVLYILLVFILSISAVSSITYSTFHGFYCKPAKLASSLKSILGSFLPLIATKLVTMTILTLLVFGMTLFMLLLYTALVLLGFNVDYNNIYFLGVVILMVVLLVGLMGYLVIEWSLTDVIAVVESKWGPAPLTRSSYLVKGNKGVALLMIVFFGFLSGLMSILNSNLKAKYEGDMNEGCVGWTVVQMVGLAALYTVLSLYTLVAKTVLFAHCKALHGESEFQIGEKLGAEYVPLPLDAV